MSWPGRLQQVAEWPSFDALRVRHQGHFDQIVPGTYGVVRVKYKRFVILPEEDFRRLPPLAPLVEVLGDHLDVMEGAVGLMAPGSAAQMLGGALRQVRASFGRLQALA